jgi:hypothetical protein
LPGCRIASSWSPAASTVEPIAISACPFRITEISRDPSGSSSSLTVRPADDDGHGTIVASVAHAVAPGAKLLWDASRGTVASTHPIY